MNPSPFSLENTCLVTTHSEVPQAANVLTSLKADGLQAFFDAGLHGGQAGGSCSDHRHTTDHC